MSTEHNKQNCLLFFLVFHEVLGIFFKSSRKKVFIIGSEGCRIYSLVSVSNYVTFKVWGGDIRRRKQNILVVTELELMITESELAKE